MLKGTYTSIAFSIAIHGFIFLVIILTHSTPLRISNNIVHPVAIKSFIYYAPKDTKSAKQTTENKQKTTTIPNLIENIVNENANETRVAIKKQIATEKQPVRQANTNKIVKHKLGTIKATANTTAKSPHPSKLNPTAVEKLDSFSQLQNMRHKLNSQAMRSSINPYSRYQPPSIFNRNVKSVPHSVPVKDVDKERKKNTHNLGTGIAITKGNNGHCSITQDMSVYGLSEGSSTQFFNCGETIFDKNFREHMQNVKAKLGKN